MSDQSSPQGPTDPQGEGGIDAPAPPGGPQRTDSPAGPDTPGNLELDSDQTDSERRQQLENAETSLDQPSDG